MEDLIYVFQKEKPGKYLIINHLRTLMEGQDPMKHYFRHLFENYQIENQKAHHFSNEERFFLYKNLKSYVMEKQLDEQIFESMYKKGYYLKEKRVELLFEKNEQTPVFIERNEAIQTYEKMKTVLLNYIKIYLKMEQNEYYIFFQNLSEIYKKPELKYSEFRGLLNKENFQNMIEHVNIDVKNKLLAGHDELLKKFGYKQDKEII
jgi:hypothetical protein